MMKQISPASPWCQRWTAGGTHSWRHTSEGGFDPAHYHVEPISHDAAKTFVVDLHYSGTYPADKLCYGLFEGPWLLGVLVFGIPTSAAVLTKPFPDLEPYVQSVELSRFVLADAVPANAESWFLARCFTEAAAAGVRGVVSFADPCPRVVAGAVLFPGHVGTIYQATNAAFCGRGTPRSLVLLPTGQVLNARAMQKVRAQERGHDHVERSLVALGARARIGPDPAGWLADALVDIGATRLRHPGNLRYCFKLGTRTERRATVLALPTAPYPKLREAA